MRLSSPSWLTFLVIPPAAATYARIRCFSQDAVNVQVAFFTGRSSDHSSYYRNPLPRVA